MLLDVEAYTSDVRGEPCAAARDRTDGLVSVRICAGRGVGGPRKQQNPIPSALPARKASCRVGSAGRYDLDQEDDTGGKRRETAGGEVRRAEVGSAIRRARRRFCSNNGELGVVEKRRADETQPAGEGGLYQTARRLHGDVMIAIQ